jgi:hypothetical protein
MGADADPVIGKWKLNWERSHSADAAPKSAIRRYRKSKVGVRVSEIWVDAAGKRTNLDYTANYDGKDYSIVSRKGGTVAFTRHDGNIAEGVSKLSGKVVYAFKRIVSKDGNTLTIEMAKTDSAGKAFTEVLVYDKVR